MSDIKISPPPQCEYRRRITWRDRFWAWYWNVKIDDLIRCYHYEGHEQYGYPHQFPVGRTLSYRVSHD